MNKIDKLLQTDNFAIAEWEERGLIPSATEIIKELETVTQEFLLNLKKIEENQLDKKQKLEKVTILLNELPWDNFDTEEKEFLADVLAPVINYIGLSPSDIF